MQSIHFCFLVACLVYSLLISLSTYSHSNCRSDRETFYPVTLSVSFLIAPTSLACLSHLRGAFFPHQCSEYLLCLALGHYRLLSFIIYFVDVSYGRMKGLTTKLAPANPPCLSLSQYNGDVKLRNLGTAYENLMFWGCWTSKNCRICSGVKNEIF